MNISRSTLAATLALSAALAGAARAVEAPPAEERLAAALESVMTDEAAEGVEACAPPDYSGWRARSQPGAMFFECLRKPGDRTGVAKSYLPADVVQKALIAQGLSYYADYSIFDVATKKTVGDPAIQRAAARAVQRQKALKAMRGADAALPKT